MKGYYSKLQLSQIGLKSFGNNILISDKVSIYNPQNIEIGNNVRIDDFCIISAGKEGIIIGDNVHIASFCSLKGKNKIILKDFSGLSSRVAIYSSTDDYSGDYLTNPTIDSQFTNVISGDVILGKHVIVGCGALILPNVTIGDFSAVAALSMVSKNVDEGVIVGGVPSKKLKNRNMKLKELEWKYLNQ